MNPTAIWKYHNVKGEPFWQWIRHCDASVAEDWLHYHRTNDKLGTYRASVRRPRTAPQTIQIVRPEQREGCEGCNARDAVVLS